MTRYRVEVLEPTSLLPEGGSRREIFDAAWSRLGVDTEHWHGFVRLDRDGGLFVKGLYVGVLANPQHFLRRWHVRNEVRNLHALQGSGLPVPVALAWGSQQRLGLPIRSFLVQRWIGDAVDFSRYIAEAQGREERLRVFRAVGRAVRRLHEAGWIHGDLACRNLLVRPRDGGVVFVDLARLLPADPGRLGWRRRKELYRLVKSADKCGAAPQEVDVMLRAAAGEAAEDVIAATRALRRIDRRMARKWRTWLWRATGLVR